MFRWRKKTPNIDKLAAMGLKFSECYASPICSPSRASLLTGCYAQRVGIPGVLGYSGIGINPEEKLLPEMLQEIGYNTALFGKWHLGGPDFHPQKNGFNEFFGTLASNDMGFDMNLDSRRYGKCGFYLFDGTDTLTLNPNQWELVRNYTEKSVDFIKRKKDEPFFLWLSHNMPHTPIFVSNDFAGKSRIDLYHDVLAELDWSVGEIIKTLEEYKITDKTLVIFISDNGPWLIFGNHGDSAYPLSGGKRQTLEGGVRVPCIMALPGVIPQSTECNTLTTIMDFYPTIAELTKSTITENKIDGKNILPLMKGLTSEGPHEAYYYYHVNALQAIRVGDFKLQLPHLDFGTPNLSELGYDGLRGKTIPVNRPLALYNIKKDPGEQIDISHKNPQIVIELIKIAERVREDLGDSIRKIEGEGKREPGKIESSNEYNTSLKM
jgi:arylsulfatase A-like enzyme